MRHLRWRHSWKSTSFNFRFHPYTPMASFHQSSSSYIDEGQFLLNIKLCNSRAIVRSYSSHEIKAKLNRTEYTLNGHKESILTSTRKQQQVLTLLKNAEKHTKTRSFDSITWQKERERATHTYTSNGSIILLFHFAQTRPTSLKHTGSWIWCTWSVDSEEQHSPPQRRKTGFSMILGRGNQCSQ